MQKLLLVDDEETQKNVKEHLKVSPTLLSLFQSRFSLGHSQRSQRERIGLFVESTDEKDVRQIVEMIYERLIVSPDKEGLVLLSYSPEKFYMTQQAIEWLKKQHEGEFILTSDERNEIEEILMKKKKVPKLSIEAHRIVTEAEIGKQFDSLRILIDWGNNPDEFIQTTAISTGIPQLYRRPIKRIKDYQNGLVCKTIKELNNGLNYYIGNLKHWNESVVYNVQLMNKYSTVELLKKWQTVLEK